jgi:hypothetical protein
MCLQFNTVAREAAKHFDQSLGPNSWQLAQWQHLSETILTHAAFAIRLDHAVMMRAKPVITVKI